MKLKIFTTENAEAGQAELPAQFDEPVRTDLISRSIFAIQAANRQPYGGYGNAGMRHVTKLSRRRRDYKTSYGYGISRVPRKITSRRGRRMNWVGALSPGTTGGRRAHPPKPYADWEQKVNTTENRKAIRSALAATVQKDLVSQRGHKIPTAFPFIIDNGFETLTKTSQLEAALVKLGFAAEIARAGVKRIRAGHGKARGRPYKRPTSILFVVSKDATPLVKAAANLPGADVIAVHRVNAEILAPGTHVGRLTLYTRAAIERLSQEGLFTKEYKNAASHIKKRATARDEKSEAAPKEAQKDAKPKATPKAAKPKTEKKEMK
jgi:large subunit ribosomal protein L4e